MSKAALEAFLNRLPVSCWTLFLVKELSFGQKLCVGAEKMVEELRLGAMQIWMDSQGNLDAGDHHYPVKGFFRRARGEASAVSEAGESALSPIPLSTTVFRAAMQNCNSRVSAYRMAKSQELQEKSKTRETEQKLQHEALAKISASPRHETVHTHGYMSEIDTKSDKFEEILIKPAADVFHPF